MLLTQRGLWVRTSLLVTALTLPLRALTVPASLTLPGSELFSSVTALCTGRPGGPVSPLTRTYSNRKKPDHL